MIRKLRILKSNFIGVYCRVSEDYAILPRTTEDSVADSVRELFDVKVIRLLVGNSTLIGALMALNGSSIVVSRYYHPDNTIMEEDLNVVIIRDRLNAMGNNIVMNDHAAIIHKDFSSSTVKKLQDSLGIEVIRSTIGGIKTVGSVSVVTEKGMLVTPTVTEDEQKFLADLFKVQVKTGTANFGSIYVGTSILANTRGIAVGEATTSIEIGRVDDTLS